MKNVLPADLHVFCAVVRASSFSGAAAGLGMSPAYVTKRIRVLEEALATTLFHRTTRRVVTSEAGERIYHWAQRVLDDVDHLIEEVGITRSEPRGLLRVCSSFGFGRRIVAPALSAFSAQHGSVQVHLEVFDRLIDVAAEGYDLDVRVGDEIAPHLIARPLADNHRVLCASPAYLEANGTPKSLDDLAAHTCLVVKERDHPFGVWRLQRGRREHTVKVRGSLSTNNGEMSVNWAVDGGATHRTGPTGACIAPVPARGQHLGGLPFTVERLGQGPGLRGIPGGLYAGVGDVSPRFTLAGL
jgi:LysR family transcriptional activator of dmlA